jgi:2'-5' RNA ligase
MRLFVAIDMPENILDELEPLLKAVPAGRPSTREQMHLTLFFLGDVPEKDCDQLKDALQPVAISPFRLRLEGVGCFPSPKRPRILWVGMTPSPSLLKLKKQIDAALLPLEFLPDKKPFHPHLTLARIKNPWTSGIPQFLQDHHKFSSEEFVVKKFHLYSSNLTPKGAVYTKVRSFELI